VDCEKEAKILCMRIISNRTLRTRVQFLVVAKTFIFLNTQTDSAAQSVLYLKVPEWVLTWGHGG
jgi:hypothetical protein